MFKVTTCRGPAQIMARAGAPATGPGPTHPSGQPYRASLYVGDLACTIVHARPIAIDPGDDIIVAGRLKGGVMLASAYRNLSKGVVATIPNVTIIWILGILLTPALVGFVILAWANSLSRANAAVRSHIHQSEPVASGPG